MNTQITVASNNDNLNFIITAIDTAKSRRNKPLADSSKRQYKKAVINAVDAGVNLLDADAINEYSLTIGSSTRSFLKASLRLLTRRLELDAKSGATPDNALAVQALTYRLEALNASITVEQHTGTKAHKWLTSSQIMALLEACKTRKSGNAEAAIVTQRDRLAIALCVGAGLRRLEAVGLEFSDVVKQGERYVLNVTGKGAKDRVIPISNRLHALNVAWHAVVGDGRILRSLGRKRVIGASMSTVALYNIVQKRGTIAHIENLQPHDLRRTFAQVAYVNGIPIAQISLLLGHASIQTTMRYLNIELNMDKTASDCIPV